MAFSSFFPLVAVPLKLKKHRYSPSLPFVACHCLSCLILATPLPPLSSPPSQCYPFHQGSPNSTEKKKESLQEQQRNGGLCPPLAPFSFRIFPSGSLSVVRRPTGNPQLNLLRKERVDGNGETREKRAASFSSLHQFGVRIESEKRVARVSSLASKKAEINIQIDI